MNLNTIFYPKSICLIGSSKLREKGNLISPEIFHNISQNISFFHRNRVIDVEKTEHLPKADLYAVSLPESITLSLIEEFKCKSCIILPGNYKQKEFIIEKMRSKRIRLLGPNSVCGIINTDNNLNTTFERNIMPEKGNFSFITQSGGIGASIFDLSFSKFTGVGKLTWLGDAWDIDFSDLIEYLSKDRQTKSIGLYIEGIRKSKRFMEAVKHAKKPIVALKGGTSEAGAKRAFSHTASLSGSSKIYLSMFKQTGIVESKSIEELYEVTRFLSKDNKMKSNRVAIISNMGGHAILASDYVHSFDMRMPDFSEKTTKAIERKYPVHAINPLDLVADADGERYVFCLERVLEDEQIDAVLLIIMLKSCMLRPVETIDIAKIIKKSRKPVVASVPAFDDWNKIRAFMSSEGVYVFNDLERSVKTIKAIHDYNLKRK